jgi:AraC-like DNA-binding protein
MDILSNILDQIDLSSSFYYRTSFGGKWGLSMPKDETTARFHIVSKGSFWLFVEQEKYHTEIKEGDILIVFRGLEHKMSDGKKSKILSEIEFNNSSHLTDSGVLNFGDQSSKVTNIICGHFSFAKNKTHPFLSSLPNILHIKKEDNNHSSWLTMILDFIDFESKNSKAGTEIILKKLTEIIFIQAFRVYLETNKQEISYFNLINDSYAKKALDSIHMNPSEKWTLEKLALIAGMSRTNFSKHFKSISGITPIEYLTNWRLERAKDMLTTTDIPIAEIANTVGYEASEYFQKIFKKNVGVTPSTFRKKV